MSRPAPDDLTALVAEARAEPGAWEFFALVRAFEQFAPAAPRVGTALDPGDEPLDLAHEPGLAFPRTSLAGVDAGRRRPRVRSQHLGLTGPMGPLPTHLTEIALAERSASGPHPFNDFLDLLASRMLQAHYRAWSTGEPCAQADRPGDDAFAGCLGAVSGAVPLRFVSGAERPGPEADGLGEWRRLAYGGHLAGLRSAAAVGDFLAHLLARPVTVGEAVGRWRAIPPGDLSRIARAGPRHALGAGVTLGRRFFATEWDVVIGVRARSMDELEWLLPGGDGHALLADGARAVLPPHIDWQARIEIDEAAIRPARLGAARLGMTGWVSPRGRARVRNDVRLDGAAGPRRRAGPKHATGEVA